MLIVTEFTLLGTESWWRDDDVSEDVTDPF